MPPVSVLAERVRVGNAAWGSKPQMLEIGRLSAQIGLWSLNSGPVDVRSFELSNVSVLLEKNSEGRGNWELGGARPSDESTSPDSGATEVPAISTRVCVSPSLVTVSSRAPQRGRRRKRVPASKTSAFTT